MVFVLDLSELVKRMDIPAMTREDRKPLVRRSCARSTSVKRDRPFETATRMITSQGETLAPLRSAVAYAATRRQSSIAHEPSRFGGLPFRASQTCW